MNRTTRHDLILYYDLSCCIMILIEESDREVLEWQYDHQVHDFVMLQLHYDFDF